MKARTPTSAPGSSCRRPASAHRLRRPHVGRARGFTLIELMVVVTLVAIAAGMISLALRDSAAERLEHEAARLSALLEAARAEARASGLGVRFELASADNSEGAQFRFVGLPPTRRLPTRWLADGTQAEIVGARALVLGPEPVLPPQRIVLALEGRTLALGSDGLGPFVVQPQATP